MVTLENMQHYSQAIDGPDERLEKYSIISYFAIESESRQDWPRIVTRTEVTYAQYPYGITFDPS